MRIAILGATSEIAKDLILSISIKDDHHLHLFARRPDCVKKWLNNVGLAERYLVDEFERFGTQEFDTIINFVGVGNPAQTVAMGALIYDITLQFDEIALNYVRHYPECRYIFLSSGAAYGSSFDEPVVLETKATIAINNLKPQDWYAVAKLHAECRHRSLAHLPIVDVRIFNYFSHSQNMDARFLITDIVRAIRDNTVLKTSPDFMVRDFLHPSDFHRLISVLLSTPPINVAVDSYSRAPIDKRNLLVAMQEKFGLKYEVTKLAAGLNATGGKPHYYSLNTRAAEFGYIPSLTSLQGVTQEIECLLGNLHFKEK
jgi:Nucleoside-diphosphate-sugar epimerases